MLVHLEPHSYPPYQDGSECMVGVKDPMFQGGTHDVNEGPVVWDDLIRA